MTKIYCDIADLILIKKYNKKNLVKGFTTNPSLIRKAGAKNYINYCRNILETTSKPVSIEVFADDEKNILKQARIINKLGKNVYVKIPVTDTSGKFLGKVISNLNKENIKLNITAVYSHNQTIKILNKINKRTKVIISIFAGRMSDAGKDPIKQIKKSIYLSKKYKNVEILWASTREAYNFLNAKKLGCHIITIPPSIIDKIEKFGKSFKNLTIDTVKGFLIDSRKSKFKI